MITFALSTAELRRFADLTPDSDVWGFWRDISQAHGFSLNQWSERVPFVRGKAMSTPIACITRTGFNQFALTYETRRCKRRPAVVLT